LAFKRIRWLFIGLLAALALAACGAPVTQVWPGVVGADGIVYVARNQHLHAVDAATGRQAWQYPPQGDTTGGLFASDPGLGEDVVVIGSELNTGGIVPKHSGVVYGIERATGSRLWCVAFDPAAAERVNCASYSVQGAGGLFGLGGAVDTRIVGGITVAGDGAYFGLNNGHVFALDAATGEVRWSFTGARRDVWAAPVVDENAVYVGSLDHHLYALDRGTGDLLWSEDMGAALAGTPSLRDGRLYVGTFGSRLAALDAATGDEVWSVPTGNWVWSGPAFDNGTLFVADVSGTLYAFPAGGGDPLWRATPGGQMRARPAVAEEQLYAGDRQGTLYAVSLGNGSVLWQVKLQRGQILVEPVVTGGVIVVAPYNGANLLEAYHPSGQFAWAFNPAQ
jgi:outer membrane protein assembly factor BamB